MVGPLSPGRRRLLLVLALGALAAGAVALVIGDPDAARAPAAPAAGTPVRRDAPAPAGAATTPVASRERSADHRLPVPLARAAARLLLVGFAGADAGTPLVAKLGVREWGAVLVGRANVVSADQLGGLTAVLGESARAAGHREPLVVAAQLGGTDVALAGVGPSRQDQQDSPAHARDEARAAGRALRAAGVDAVLAPAADLAVAGGPWEGRGFPGDPGKVRRVVAGAVAGWRAAGIVPVVGHFPGEGAASQDPGLAVATVGEDRDTLEEVDGAPFAGLPSDVAIQMSGALYAGWDGVTPATLDPAVVRDLRRRGFRGAVVSADLTAATRATGQTVGAAAVRALAAGCDLLLVPGDAGDQEDAYQAVLRAVRSGRIPAARVREALTRSERLRRGAG